MFYRCKWFEIEELVPPDVFDQRGEKSWELLDVHALETLDRLREYFQVPITINNWHIGGFYSQSGFRHPTSRIGSGLSQHRFGRAFDCKFKGLLSDDVRSVILQYPEDPAFEYITAIELDVPWLHFDTRNHGRFDKIMTFKP